MNWSTLAAALSNAPDAPEPTPTEITIEVPGIEDMTVGWCAGDQRFAIFDQPAHGMSRADLIALQTAIAEILAATNGA